MESVLERKSRELRRRQEELAFEKRLTQALRDKVAATIRAIEAAQKAEQRVASAVAALAKKLAFVDRKIAWFGSLNMLSHSQSSELMILFSQPDPTARLTELSGTPHLLRNEKRRSVKEQRLKELSVALKRRMAFPSCPECGGPTELRIGKYGPFFGCASYRSNGCQGLVNVPRRVLELAVADLELACPQCGGEVVLKSGRNGVFLGCSRYPECRWADSF